MKIRGLKSLVLTAFFGLSATGAHSSASQFDEAMKPILSEYLKIHDALASDSIKGVAKSAATIVSSSKTLDSKSVQGEHAEHYKNLPEKLANSAQSLVDTTDIKTIRKNFKTLSQNIVMWTSMSKPEGLSVLYCSMSKGSWVQKSGETRNPYYGKSMLKCGEVVK